MKTATLNISDEVKSVLQRSTVECDRVILPAENLDRKLYEQVDKVLKAAGGKWNRTAKAHLFVRDPRVLLKEALQEGKMIDEKKTYQEFYPPEALANKMVSLLELKPDHKVLEPSAGNGALIKPILAAKHPASQIQAIELNPKNFEALSELGVKVAIRDFICSGLDPLKTKFDRIIMNPPYTNGQDIEHVLEAFGKHLKPGGLLVALTSKAFKFRQDSKFEQFRDLHRKNVIHEETIPEGTFKESGTNVETVLIVWRKQK